MRRLASSLQELRSLDQLAAAAALENPRDPRASVLLSLLFVLTVVSFDRYQVAALLPLALFPTVLAAQAGLPARTLGRALLLASPVALMVGIFNPLLDPAPMLAWRGYSVSAGWISYASIVLRFALTASVAIVLLAATGMVPLCAALARLGVPKIFTVQLLFLYRYLFVLAGEALRLDTARSLRAGAQQRMSIAQYSALLGPLLLRAVDRATRVHQAMLARGFDGELRLQREWQWRTADSLYLIGWSLYFLVVRLIDLPGTAGHWLSRAAA